MTIYYSATTNAFYDSQVYNVNNIPEDKVAVSASTYNNLMAQQCAGRVIVAAADGTPTTIAQTCGPCTSTKYATKTELTNGLASKANDNAVVHKTGNENINGVKSFGDIIKATNGAVQVGADTGYNVTFNYNGNITSKQARGTYNIFLPDANGTLALTSDIDGKANDSAVVHTSGDENISGNKFFTQDVNVKNSDVDIAVTPSNNLFSCFRFRGKGNVTTASIQYSQRTYGVNDICFYVFDASSNSHGFRIRTDNILEPIENNTYSLGSPNNKWANVYATTFNGNLKGNADTATSANDPNAVHRSGNETIEGFKTFSNTIHRSADLTTSGGEQVYRFNDTNANSCGHIYNNVYWRDNAVFNRYGTYNAKSGKAMEIDIISSDDGSGVVFVTGTATNRNLADATSATGHNAIATMGWVNNPATSTNVVHRSGDETINGSKTFTSDIYFKNNYIDLTVTPSSDMYSNFIFTDKNNQVVSYMQYAKTTVDEVLGLFVNDKNKNLHGLQITSNNNVLPLTHNTYSLGASGAKWANVYATTFNGDLKGNADNGIDSSGTNYIKFKDGTQICWGSNRGGDIITFANAFTTTPSIAFGYNIGSDFEEIIHGQARYSSSTSFIMQVWNFNSNTWEHDRHVEWIAIGRWK